MDPKELKYDKNQHLWFIPEEDHIVVGITDYAQDKLGEILFVELPETESFNEEDYLFCIESGKKDQELMAPFDLEVIEVNEDLEDEPELLNEAAFENWIFKAKIDDPEILNKLADFTEYSEVTK